MPLSITFNRKQGVGGGKFNVVKIENKPKKIDFNVL